MSQKANHTTTLATPRNDPLALDQFLAQLSEEISRFRQHRETAATNRSMAVAAYAQAETWDALAAESLHRIIELLRGRCGDDFIAALATLAGEIHQEALDDQADEDVDEERRWTTTDREEGIDLGNPDVEKQPYVDRP